MRKKWIFFTIDFLNKFFKNILCKLTFTWLSKVVIKSFVKNICNIFGKLVSQFFVAIHFYMIWLHIFFYRVLRVPRIAIHKNLFASLLLYCVSMITFKCAIWLPYIQDLSQAARSGNIVSTTGGLVQVSLGTNSSMFTNCSLFCDVSHVRSSVLGQNVMFRSVRSSVLLLRDQTSHVLEHTVWCSRTVHFFVMFYMFEVQFWAKIWCSEVFEIRSGCYVTKLVLEWTPKYRTSNIECPNIELSKHHILVQNQTSNMSNITKNWIVREHQTVCSKTILVT